VPIQPPIHWVQVNLSPGVKLAEREADYSLPSSAEVQCAWRYTSTPPHVLMSWCQIKPKGNFTFFNLPVFLERNLSKSVLRNRSRDSSVGIATGWTDGVRLPAGARDFSLLHSVQTNCGAHPASYPMGTVVTRPGVKLTTKCRGQEWWSYTSTPPYAFMAWCLLN
jgi:hypothetical protein